MMDIIQEINSRYLAMEVDVDNQLQKIKREEKTLNKLTPENKENSSGQQHSKMLTYVEATTRNANLLKSLETCKARLRSLTTYSPIEEILKKAVNNYKNDIESLYCFDESNEKSDGENKLN